MNNGHSFAEAYTLVTKNKTRELQRYLIDDANYTAGPEKASSPGNSNVTTEKPIKTDVETPTKARIKTMVNFPHYKEVNIIHHINERLMATYSKYDRKLKIWDKSNFMIVG